ncbi:MAG: ParB/RepB/Spo0J family partition protein [Eubacteriales bacterium]|nr:ParB/RepB/Spo0J family partition protein [Eubacteriales bacterium]
MVAKKTGLGKGLDALIPAGPKKESVKSEKQGEKEKVSQSEKDGVQEIRIAEIEPNRKQPRKNFDEDSLLELSDSIKQFGVIQPLIVQKKDNHYEIIAGERRWRAAKQAGIKKVPVIIKEYTPQEVMEISLIENIQREDLNPIEEALAYKNLLEEFHLKQDEVAERVSKSRTAVTNSIRLLKLDERVQQMVIDDMISTGHARALLSLENKELQNTVAGRIFDEKLSVRETEKLVKSIQKGKIEKKKPEKVNSFVYKDIEEKIKAILGTKVAIDHKSNNRGKITIEYYSNEELERIVDLMESIK